MPYEPETSGWLKKVGGAIATILIVLVVGALARGGTRAAIDHAEASPSSIRAGIETERRQDPTLDALFEAVERHYPERYAAFIDDISTAVRNGETSDQISRRGFNFTRELTLEASQNLHKAPATKLRKVMNARNSVLEALSAESSTMCANYAQEGLKPYETPSRRVLKRISVATTALLEASSEASMNPQPMTEPREDAWLDLGDGMLKRGVTDIELQAFDNGNLTEISDERICSTAIAMHNTLDAMPEPDGMAIYRVMQAPQ